jgi:hypothetical protein
MTSTLRLINIEAERSSETIFQMLFIPFEINVVIGRSDVIWDVNGGVSEDKWALITAPLSSEAC